VFSRRAFFGFTALTDPTRHAEYNEWHQLDHLPENLLQPGVAWGDRWVLTPDCAELSVVGDPAHAGHQYALMYWFRDPAEASVAVWREVNERTIHWGRRPELSWTSRRPLGFFNPVKGYVHPRVLVSADALPFRPHRGVWLSITQVQAPQSPAAVALFRRYDREWLPSLLACPGVAGAWTFSYAAPPDGFGSTGAGNPESPGSLVLRLLYLDADPTATTRAIHATRGAWADEAAEVERVVLAAPFRTITPWQWDWFETSGARS
jgi:hypothetical protein